MKSARSRSPRLALPLTGVWVGEVESGEHAVLPSVTHQLLPYAGVTA